MPLSRNVLLAGLIVLLFPQFAFPTSRSTQSAERPPGGIVSGGIVTEEPGRAEPWRWSDDARVSALLDERAAAVRVEAAQRRQSHRGIASSALPQPHGTTFVDVIDGRRDPHLFFPFELFQHFVLSAYTPNVNVRIAYRSSKSDALRQHELPADMWERLEAITAAYRGAMQHEESNAPAYNRTQQADSRQLRATTSMCRDRHAALLEAQATFGPEFTKFLYTAVAPDIQRRLLRRADRTRLLRAANGECE
jgi:hypothetical protein